MDRRQAYERELLSTIAGIARGPGIADETRSLERMLMSRIAKAVDEMRAAIAAVNQDSALVTIDGQAFDDFLADEIPSMRHWEEKIAYAVKGW